MKESAIVKNQHGKTVAGCQTEGKVFSLALLDKEGTCRMEMDEQGFALLYAAMLVFVEKKGIDIEKHMSAVPADGISITIAKESVDIEKHSTASPTDDTSITKKRKKLIEDKTQLQLFD